MTPAFTSSSLKLPIAASNSGLGRMPASEFLSALTMTMNRMRGSCERGLTMKRIARFYPDVERGDLKSTGGNEKMNFVRFYKTNPNLARNVGVCDGMGARGARKNRIGGR